MRSSVRWVLVGTLALSCWTMLSEQRAGSAVAVVEASRQLGDTGGSDASAGEGHAILPAVLDRAVLEPAKRDIFALLKSSHVAQAPKTVIFIGPEAPLPPPPPPTLNYRYAGQMTTPEGQRLVYLSKGTDITPVEVGTRLEEGYVVEAISSEAVALRYPPRDAKAVVPIPKGEPQ